MLLYRPVGEIELQLIKDSGYKSFPPRLPEQPIFYPVLNCRYAEEIAEKWNTKDVKSGKKGYVLEFEIDDDYISKFDVIPLTILYSIVPNVRFETIFALNLSFLSTSGWKYQKSASLIHLYLWLPITAYKLS